MENGSTRSSSVGGAVLGFVVVLGLAVLAASTGLPGAPAPDPAASGETATLTAEDGPAGPTARADEASSGPQTVDRETILRGRQMVVEHACGGCHGGGSNPAAEGWLAGVTDPRQEFRIGPCIVDPEATSCFRTRPRNLTPDTLTGLGRFSERQIFNALRFGLRPGETADVEITSGTPGEGNFPLHPKYLAPPMPWPSWRHIADDDLWAIVSYLKHGLKPVNNQVADSEGPPDFWTSEYTVEKFGTHPAAAFPTGNEVRPTDGEADLDEVLRGRQMVVEHACADCHGGFSNPAADGWLAGVMRPEQELPGVGCREDVEEPCLVFRPRNLTPDEATGLGAFSERQIFNAIRHGLRPGGTPDVDIGEGTFPEDPDYLAPAMPWYEFRHMADEDVRAIAAYLKHGLKPVSNQVEDSDRPPEGWAAGYTEEVIGPYPAAPFPTANEVGG